MTKITLRRAAALQIIIKDAIRSKNVVPQAQLSFFADFPNEVKDHAEKLVENIKARDALTHALFEIRTLTGKANATSGVSSILDRMAELDMQISTLQPLAEGTPYEGPDITAKRASRLETREEAPNMYGRAQEVAETLSVNLASSRMIEDAKANLASMRKSRLDLQDRLLELNVGTRIEVSEQTLKTLIEERVL